MNRAAVFVDAGYLFAQGSLLLAGQKLSRSEIRLAHDQLVEALRSFAERVSGCPLLRIYWYDGTSTGPSSQHIAIAHLSYCKLRLGFVNSAGQQKGVDSLIITDMISLARNRAMSEAVLLSGDEDLRVGVQQAQEFGVRVHLLGIKPSRGNQSLFLLQEADSCHEWTETDLSGLITCSPKEEAPESVPSAPVASSGNPDEDLRTVAQSTALSIPENELGALLETIRGSGQIPRELDGRLLGRSREPFRRDLNGAEKRRLRALFVEECELLLPTAGPTSMNKAGAVDVALAPASGGAAPSTG